MTSYPPLRPLPKASSRPVDAGPARFVDPRHGDDRHDGTQDAPWRTLAHAVAHLAAGQTLYLRGGVYWESVSAGPQGTPEAPITIRSHPGELAILDGGIREFVEYPAQAWEPYPQGGEGEFRSTNSHRQHEVGGNFGDSMVPLRMYGSFADLRSASEYEAEKGAAETGVYVGPGVKRDEATGRIHVRLSHTTLSGLGDGNYRGETDPRNIPLIITGSNTGLTLKGARHVRVQDLVIRGSLTAVNVLGCRDIQLDGVTIYATRYGIDISDTDGFRLTNSALRGFDAPWHPRASGADVDCFCPLDLVTAVSGRDFEFAYNELTDHHDCIQIGDIDAVRFHHNLVDHFNDDGIDLELSKLGTHHIFENRISRCLTPFSIHEGAANGHDDTAGVYVYRNVIDLRRGIYSSPPTTGDAADQANRLDRRSSLIGDHGSPVWPPVFFYHNTVLQKHPAYRGYYASGMGYLGLNQTSRRVFNNIFVHQLLVGTTNAKANFVLPPKPADVDLQVDGNLFWGVEDGPALASDYFAAFQASPTFQESKQRYPPGWTAHDVCADPRFDAWAAEGTPGMQLTLPHDSPAVNAGVAIPSPWPDPAREQDNGAPDIGAVPVGAAPWTIGVQGRLSAFP